MTQTTGGHYRDTGDGPTPIGVLAGNALESRGRTAYRAYVDHSQSCDECAVRLQNCDEGKALWTAYTDARGLT
jgi:hypothetical protein